MLITVVGAEEVVAGVVMRPVFEDFVLEAKPDA